MHPKTRLERDYLLASRLSNTAFQVGAALDVAIVTTVAVSCSEDYLAAHEGADPLAVLTEGFQSAFVACVVLAGIGVALALLLLGRPRKAPRERLEPLPGPAPRPEEREGRSWIGPRRSSTTPTAGSRSTSATTSRPMADGGHPFIGRKTLLLVTRVVGRRLRHRAGKHRRRPPRLTMRGDRS